MPHLLQDPSVISVACVSECPTNGSLLNNCTGWNDYCNNASGAPTANYSTIKIGDVYCSPDPTSVPGVTQVTSGASLTQSVEDVKNAKYVLIGAIGAAFILGIIYFVFLRFCAGVVIWLSLIFFVLSMIAIGVYMFLFTEGIELIKVPFNLSTANKDSMRIASYVLWAVSVLVIILTIVLYKTIKLGNVKLTQPSVSLSALRCTSLIPAMSCSSLFSWLYS
jgi:hypothetical protein